MYASVYGVILGRVDAFQELETKYQERYIVTKKQLTWNGRNGLFVSQQYNGGILFSYITDPGNGSK